MLDDIRRAKGLTYRELSEAIGGAASEESVKRHFLGDSGNSFLIARLIEFFFMPPAPTPPSQWFQQGLIAEKFQEKANIKGLSYKDIATLALTYWKLPIKDVKGVSERIRKYYEESSTNGYLTALQCPVFGYPSFHPGRFEKPRQKELLLNL